MSSRTHRRGPGIKGSYAAAVDHKRKHGDQTEVDEDPFQTDTQIGGGFLQSRFNEIGRANTRQHHLDDVLGQGTSAELLAHTDIESNLGEKGLGYLTTAAQYFNNLMQISAADRVRARLFNTLKTGGSTAGLNPEIAQQVLKDKRGSSET